MLKFKITKTQFDKLSDDMKAHYEEAEGGKHYTLDVTGLPEQEDTGALTRALERVREELKDAEKERDEAETKLNDLEKSRSSGEKDVDKLTKRYEAKLADAKTDADAKVEGLRGTIKKLLVDNAAGELANRISTVPALMRDHIRGRLDVEIPDDGEPKLIVLKDGKPSDLTVEKLGEEFVANKEFSAIITGSKARGGGTPSTANPSPGGADQDKPTDLTKSDPKDLVAHLTAVREAKQSA